MATMNISLPDQMKAWIEEQVATGRYSNSSDVLRDLIRREQRRADLAFDSNTISAIQRGLVLREEAERFIPHDAAMDRLDAAIAKVEGTRR